MMYDDGGRLGDQNTIVYLGSHMICSANLYCPRTKLLLFALLEAILPESEVC